MTALLGRARRYVPPLIPRELPPPYGPDRIVFGEQPPRSREHNPAVGVFGQPVNPAPSLGHLYRCPRHDVTWRGSQPCFAPGGETCEPELLW